MEPDNGTLFRSFEHDLQRGGRKASQFPRVDQVHEVETLIDYALIDGSQKLV